MDLGFGAVATGLDTVGPFPHVVWRELGRRLSWAAVGSSRLATTVGLSK